MGNSLSECGNKALQKKSWLEIVGVHITTQGFGRNHRRHPKVLYGFTREELYTNRY